VDSDKLSCSLQRTEHEHGAPCMMRRPLRRRAARLGLLLLAVSAGARVRARTPGLADAPDSCSAGAHAPPATPAATAAITMCVYNICEGGGERRRALAAFLRTRVFGAAEESGEPAGAATPRPGGAAALAALTECNGWDQVRLKRTPRTGALRQVRGRADAG